MQPIPKKMFSLIVNEAVYKWTTFCRFESFENEVQKAYLVEGFLGRYFSNEKIFNLLHMIANCLTLPNLNFFFKKK